MFPSPYGVTVIKSGSKRGKFIFPFSGRFPSPYGVTVIKSNVRATRIYPESKFPSPYGVTVIKSYTSLVKWLQKPIRVSVPLRGNGN